MNKNLIKRLAIFCISLCLVLFPCLILLFTGSATPFVSSFAVDMYERLYIGTTNIILVYENGSLVNTIDPLSSRSYVFTINENGNILLSTSTKIYLMDLNGNVLDTQEDQGAQVYNQIQYSRGRFVSANGDVYRIADFLGWTHIIKNDTEIVYRISFLSLLVKVLIGICVIALFAFPVWLAINQKN